MRAPTPARHVNWKTPRLRQEACLGRRQHQNRQVPQALADGAEVAAQLRLLLLQLTVNTL